jgi:hypothetical protein
MEQTVSKAHGSAVTLAIRCIRWLDGGGIRIFVCEAG